MSCVPVWPPPRPPSSSVEEPKSTRGPAGQPRDCALTRCGAADVARSCGWSEQQPVDPDAMRSARCRSAMARFWGEEEEGQEGPRRNGLQEVLGAVTDPKQLRGAVAGALDLGVRMLQDTREKVVGPR